MKAIQGKQAYFGSHTFKATSNVVDGKKVTCLTVYKSFGVNKYEGTYFFNSKKQLLDLANDKECSFQFLTGTLDGIHYEHKLTHPNKRGVFCGSKIISQMPRIDYFLSCFKHNIN